MTDLEICKAIAKIEGLSKKEAAHYKKVVNGAGICIGFKPYNPLTDDALCFRLMVKHGLELSPLYRGDWCASHIDRYDYEECPVYGNAQGVDENPNKAICLAIIAKHEENQL